MNVDYFETPSGLIERMLDAVEDLRVEVVLDPAAGDGRLIERALHRWPEARAIAVDIDSARVDRLRACHPEWTVVHADFLDLAEAKLLPDPTSRVLAIMNPPFSGRGGGTWSARWLTGETIACGRAMAFVMAAARLVTEGGHLVAVVPAGVTTNVRDAWARELLARAGEMRTVETSDGYAFPSVAAHTSVISWLPGRACSDPNVVGTRPSARSPQLVDISVGRGALPVFRAAERQCESGLGVPFLHTTSIKRSGAIDPLFEIVPRECERIISAPFVVLPRVGRPSIDKVALYTGPPAVLSDCLFALSHRAIEMTELLFRRVVVEWPRVASRYGGSCAPFLRLEDVVAVVCELSLEVALAASSAELQPYDLPIRELALHGSVAS